MFLNSSESETPLGENTASTRLARGLNLRTAIPAAATATALALLIGCEDSGQQVEPSTAGSSSSAGGNATSSGGAEPFGFAGNAGGSSGNATETLGGVASSGGTPVTNADSGGSAAGGASTAGGGGGAGQGGVVGSAGQGGAGTSASCVGSAHPVCLDFESGKLDTPWSLGARNSAGTSAKVDMTRAAHGQFALHLSGFKMQTSALIHTDQLGDIQDVMWGRYYLYMAPGAPTGHGGMVHGTDQAGDWYELGFEYNSFLGNWHPVRPNPGNWVEKAMRSHDVIPKAQWACVEFLFDGAQPDVAQIWYDGKQVTYYSVMSYCDPATNPCDITLGKAQHFKSFDIGVEFYHGTSLDPTMWSGDGPPTITDAFIDDVALDTKRIGCL